MANLFVIFLVMFNFFNCLFIIYFYKSKTIGLIYLVLCNNKRNNENEIKLLKN
jgi:hypothetical protein